MPAVAERTRVVWMMPAAMAVFFASGFAALLYQVIWQRILVIFSGTDVHAATIVVAAFMAGLGCGGLIGGRVADRLSRSASLLSFAAAEMAIAAFGLISPTFFYRFLYLRFGTVNIGLPVTAAVLFVSLLWPTFLMGASLPLLSRALTRSLRSAALTVGALYGFNTLGAAVGALCATWIFLPRWGMEGSVVVAVIVNVGCAFAALVLAVPLRTDMRRAGLSTTAAADENVALPATGTRGSDGSAAPLRVLLALFALSGFLALSFEIVWFRLLGIMLKATSYTFGTVLAIYLLGLGIGAAVGAAVAGRVRRPALMFVVLQAAAGFYAVLVVTVFVGRLTAWPALHWFAEYYRGSEALDVRTAVVHLRAFVSGGSADVARWPSDFFRLYGLLPAVLICPATIMMGCSFPLLQKVAQTDLALVGRRVGVLLAANIAGCTTGAFVTGWTLLDWLGTAGALRLLAALSAVFGMLGIRYAFPAVHRWVRVNLYAAVAGSFLVLCLFVPSGPSLWAALHGSAPEGVIVGEDASGVSVLRSDTDFRAPQGASPQIGVFIDGVRQSWIPYGDIHTVLGALPAFFHPHPRTAAIIGLGSGDTLYGLAGRREIERITSIEIIGPQLRTLRELARRVSYAPLTDVIGSGRIDHILGDGRLYLSRTAHRYDIVEADALRPTNAYSGNMYSEGYFELLRSRLNPGGLAVTWSPTERVAQTFVKVFPHVWRAGQVLVGSNDPIEVDRDAVLQQISSPAVENYFNWAHVDIASLMRPYLRGPFRRYDLDFNRAALLDINTDLYPKDEFELIPWP